MKPAIIAFALFFSGVSAAAAADHHCRGAANTVEMNACLANVLQREESRLNRTYRQVLKALKESAETGSQGAVDAQARLAAAQKLWRQFRDADCSAVYEAWREGSIRNAQHLMCKIERTQHRRKELAKDWLTAN